MDLSCDRRCMVVFSQHPDHVFDRKVMAGLVDASPDRVSTALFNLRKRGLVKAVTGGFSKAKD
jgi:DNA-binding IscR family transcriptional regulator